MSAVTVPLDVPIVRGEQSISELTIRKPGPGELRGLNMLAIAQMDTTTMIKLLPRIVMPMVTEADVSSMDLSDFMACAAEVAGFLPTKAQSEDFPTT